MITLVQIKVSDVQGRIMREIVVSEATNMFNLHKILQFCIKPRQQDATIDAQAFTFTHTATGLPIGAPKSTKLYRASPATHSSQVLVGDSFMYTAGGGQYLLQIEATATGDDKYYVPRCVSGNTNLDAINKKLLVRRFTERGTGQRKKPPPLLCDRRTPASELMASHMAAMQEPLVGW